jgi:hypothetical protein
MAMKQRTITKPASSPKAGLSISLGLFKDEIEKRAQGIFLNRQDSKAAGDALSDWLQAEKEVKANHLIS